MWNRKSIFFLFFFLVSTMLKKKGNWQIHFPLARWQTGLRTVCCSICYRIQHDKVSPTLLGKPRAAVGALGTLRTARVQTSGVSDSLATTLTDYLCLLASVVVQAIANDKICKWLSMLPLPDSTFYFPTSHTTYTCSFFFGIITRMSRKSVMLWTMGLMSQVLTG